MSYAISIHALRVEGDVILRHNRDKPFPFLSTPSGWRATRMYGKLYRNSEISIHALRVEGDRKNLFKWCRPLHFYPRPPGGGRRLSPTLTRGQCSNFYPRPPGGGRQYDARFEEYYKKAFLSTPSGWRATRTGIVSTCRDGLFLSTPSGWRATRREWERLRTRRYFYPRPPGGGRQVAPLVVLRRLCISIHALRVEGDAKDL